MALTYEILAIGGGLGLFAILAGLAGNRIGSPLLLVFLILGMLAGEDGPGGIVFNDFELTYLLGSVALVVILFDGGQKTSWGMLREGAAAAGLLATVGVAVTAGVVGVTAHVLGHLDWITALLLGALVAPTDAAAVAAVLRASKVPVPHRVLAVLEVESGINDPVAVVLTVLFAEMLAHPGSVGAGAGVALLVREMVGGAVFGIATGVAMRFALRRLVIDEALYPVLLFTVALAAFGAAQLLECSGFLAVYLAGVLVGNDRVHAARVAAVERGFEAFAWVAQIALFLVLGLLVTPHEIVPFAPGAIVVAFVLIFIARPVAALLCLAPLRLAPLRLAQLRLAWRETGFIAWVGLRGAVPIYLAMIPVIMGLPTADSEFATVFVVVLASLVVQGWTVGALGRRLGFAAAAIGDP